MVLPRFRKTGKWLVLFFIMVALLVTARNVGMERTNLSRIEILLRDLLAPLESGATAVFSGTKSVAGYFTRYQELVRERQELTEEVSRLKKEVNSLTEAQLENVRLRKLIGMKEDIKPEWQTIPAKIIARDTDNWYHSVVIDRGLNDGLAKDMIVINQDGLVGRIIAVSRHTAEVLLILDREGAVGCLVQLSRTPGVVEGLGSQEILRMIHLPYDAEIKENQVVLTSGLGGIFPSGLRVGYIKQIIIEPNGLMKQALIQPFVDFNRLEEVLVLVKPADEVRVP